MSARTMQRTASANQIIPHGSFVVSEYVRKSRRMRDRRDAARVNTRVLKGLSAADVDPYMSAQELSAARNKEDGGALGRLFNLLRVVGDRRQEVADAVQAAVNLLDARMPVDPLAEAFAALDCEEQSDIADCIPQQEFNRNPTPENAQKLLNVLEPHHANTGKAIEKLKQFIENEAER